MRAPRAAFWSALLLVASAAGGEAPSEAAPDRGWDYDVRIDRDLRRMDVRLCFRGFMPRRLVAAADVPMRVFDFSKTPRGGGRLEPQPDGRHVVPRGLRPGGCLTWRVDLTRLPTRSGVRESSRVGRDLLLSPGLFLLQPALWPEDVRVTIGLDLPDGVRAAVPWPRLASGRYALDRHAIHLVGLVGFGRFEPTSFEVAGVRFGVFVLDAEHRATRKGIHTWLRKAALAVADLYGTFPSEHVTVLVQPVPARHPPVLFGRSMRAGGDHLHILLAAAAADGALPGEWVGVHEMLHLGMPWTGRGDAWLQEGFVTYYQEVLRTRAGFQTEREGWQQLHAGFGRGRRSGGALTLADESRRMAETHNYFRVYWAGAAIALRIDVEIRRRSGGKRSLDDVMRMLHRRYGELRGPNQALDVMADVDRWLGSPLCAGLARRCLQRAEFPSLDETYHRLGLVNGGWRVGYAESAPQLADRSAIMRPRGR